MPALAGHDALAVFYWETDGSGNIDFATDSTSDTEAKTFGYNTTVDDAEMDNDPVEMFDPGDPRVAERIAQMFSGTWGVSFTLSNPWIWRAVFGEASTSGSGPYTHTYDGTIPQSMQIVLPVEPTGNERILRGCVVGSVSLETSDNSQVEVSVSGAYADEEETSPGAGSTTAQVTESFDPLMFADGSLTFDGTTHSLVQSVSFSAELNVDMVSELGSRFGVDYSPKVPRFTVDWDKIVEDDSVLTTTYGGSGSTEPQDRMDGDDEFSGDLTFDNGKTGADQNQQVINFTGTFPDTHGRSGTGDPSADYTDSSNYSVRQADVVATNDTSTPL